LIQVFDSVSVFLVLRNYLLWDTGLIKDWETSENIATAGALAESRHCQCCQRPSL